MVLGSPMGSQYPSVPGTPWHWETPGPLWGRGTLWHRASLYDAKPPRGTGRPPMGGTPPGHRDPLAMGTHSSRQPVPHCAPPGGRVPPPGTPRCGVPPTNGYTCAPGHPQFQTPLILGTPPHEDADVGRALHPGCTPPPPPPIGVALGCPPEHFLSPNPHPKPPSLTSMHKKGAGRVCHPRP